MKNIDMTPKGNYFPKESTMKINKDYFYQELNVLVGRLKTIVDATISEKVQNKALKDLIGQEVWRLYNYLLEETGIKGKLFSDGVNRIV